jgi:hypothetical protein
MRIYDKCVKNIPDIPKFPKRYLLEYEALLLHSKLLILYIKNK